MQNRKAFALLSGGLDSTTTLYQAMRDYGQNVEAFSIDYGQRHIKESNYAEHTCAKLGIPFDIIHLGGILGKSMLTDDSIPVPNVSYKDIKGVSPTYVPNRNMTFIAAITSKAMQWVNEELKEGRTNPQAGVYFGAHADDALNWAYPDCTPEFIGAMANAVHVASYFHVRLHTPVMWLTKSQIVLLGQKLGVPFEDTWSCYKGEELHCGTCPTCRSRREAFQIADVLDPTMYKEGPTPTHQTLHAPLVEG